MTLEALVHWLMRTAGVPFDAVWQMTLPDIRRVARGLQPPATATAPTAADLAALMRAFPDPEPDNGSTHDTSDH